jgi:thiosulfate/3-mercaptopyruvate sulfurtransferase
MIIDHEPNAPDLLTKAHTDPRVDPGWIADHVDDPDVTVVEVDISPAAYQTGHISGAILWNAYTDLRRPDYTPIDPAELTALLSSSGISPASTIVFYGYGAYLGFWLMKRYSHDRVLLMDGPRERWERARMPWSLERPATTRSPYVLPGGDDSTVVSRDAVNELIGRPDALILDVRSPAEFAGERFWPSGAAEHTGRAGHIPGAVNVPFDLVRDEDGSLKLAEELSELYEANRVGRDRRVVTYCTIGNRASQVWFALKYVLGYPEASVYYGSWVEWGKLTGTPIET